MIRNEELSSVVASADIDVVCIKHPMLRDEELSACFDEAVFGLPFFPRDMDVGGLHLLDIPNGIGEHPLALAVRPFNERRPLLDDLLALYFLCPVVMAIYRICDYGDDR
jgi:hypothetical protein